MGCTNIRVSATLLLHALNLPEGVELLGAELDYPNDRITLTIAGDDVPNAAECRVEYRRIETTIVPVEPS